MAFPSGVAGPVDSCALAALAAALAGEVITSSFQGRRSGIRGQGPGVRAAGRSGDPYDSWDSWAGRPHLSITLPSSTFRGANPISCWKQGANKVKKFENDSGLPLGFQH